MTDFLAPFELRRVLVKFSRGPSGGTSEDVDMVTFHLAKITAGAIDAAWTTADYTTCEGKLDTWWTSQKVWHPAFMTLIEYRWFKDGPVFSPIDRGNGPNNPAERVTPRSVVGTGSTVNGMAAPQLAVSVTEVTSIRKRWGRYFLPAMVIAGSTNLFDANGRVDPTTCTTLLAFQVTLYNAWRAAGFKPVVFSRERSAHADASGGTIAYHQATAYEVTSLQLDNLADVIRSRRYGGPTVRRLTALT